MRALSEYQQLPPKLQLKRNAYPSLPPHIFIVDRAATFPNAEPTNPIWPDATNLTRRKHQALSANLLAHDAIDRIGHQQPVPVMALGSTQPSSEVFWGDKFSSPSACEF